MRKRIDVERMRKAYDYNSETGELTSKTKRDGRVVGHLQRGYLCVTVDKKHYRVHRICWAIHHGEDPGELDIDHIDRDKTNNRISNLRLATTKQNLHNSKAMGIQQKASGKWHAKIQSDGITINLGTHKCPLIAHLTYVDKAREIRGEYAPR